VHVVEATQLGRAHPMTVVGVECDSCHNLRSASLEVFPQAVIRQVATPPRQRATVVWLAPSRASPS
jgi:hypothetical protein